MTRRVRIHASVGDILQLAGVVAVCLAVGHLAGMWWAILLGGVYVIVDANVSYSGRAVGVSLPNRWDLARWRFKALTPVRVLRSAAGGVVGLVRK